MEKGRFLQHSTFIMGSKLVNYAAVFLTGVIITRSFSKTDYGTFSQVILLAMTFSLILGVWLSKSIYYFVPLHREKRQIVIQTYLILLILAAIAGSILWLLRERMAVWFSNPDLASLIFLVGLYMIMLTLWQLSESFFISVDRAHIYALAVLVFSLIYLSVLSVILSKGVTLQQLIRVIIYLYAGLNLFVLGNILALPGGRGRLIEIGLLVRQVRYAAPLFLSSFAIVLGRQLDKFIIASAYPTADFAVYFRGALELPVVTIVTFTISNMLLPQFVRLFQAGKWKDFLYVWHQAVKKTALVIFPIVMIFLFTSQRFITFLYTQRYVHSAAIFRIYVVMMLLQVTAYDCVIQATGKTRVIFYASAFNVITNLTASLVLIRWLGIQGAAVGFLLGQLVATSYYLASIRRIFGIALKHLFPWVHLLKVLGLVLLLGALTYSLHFTAWFSSKLVFMLVYGAIFTGLYMILVFRFGFVKREDLSFLKLPLRSRGRP
jgi:O-antigen/teichoic acid export membrane protein